MIPDQVDNDSIQVEGIWSAFNVTWDAVCNVDFGEVFYEVTVIKDFTEEQHVTAQNVLEYAGARELPPFSRLEVSIKAFTYWGASAQARKVVHSPPSRPTEPTNVRVFTQPEGDAKVAILRWNLPKYPNGLLTSYKIKCWFFADQQDESTDVCGSVIVSSEETEYPVRNLTPNSTYYFQVGVSLIFDFFFC